MKTLASTCAMLAWIAGCSSAATSEVGADSAPSDVSDEARDSNAIDSLADSSTDATGDSSDGDGRVSPCADAAATDADLTCPSTEPTEGASCTAGFGVCDFTSRACGVALYQCCSVWARVQDTLPCSDCPSSPPTAGAACAPTDLHCDYPRAGAKYCEYDYFKCAAGKWETSPQPCFPLCPATPPADGAPCPTSGAVCGWPSACHGLGLAVCTSGKWKYDPNCG